MPSFTLCPTHTHECYLSIGNIILKKKHYWNILMQEGKTNLFQQFHLLFSKPTLFSIKGQTRSIYFTPCALGKAHLTKGGRVWITFHIRFVWNHQETYNHSFTLWETGLNSATSSFHHSLKQPCITGDPLNLWNTQNQAATRLFWRLRLNQMRCVSGAVTSHFPSSQLVILMFRDMSGQLKAMPWPVVITTQRMHLWYQVPVLCPVHLLWSVVSKEFHF